MHIALGHTYSKKDSFFIRNLNLIEHLVILVAKSGDPQLASIIKKAAQEAWEFL